MSIIARMADYDAALAGFAALDAERLSHPWTFHGGKMEVRYALYRTLEDAQDVAVKVAVATHPEARRILALAQRAFGDLRGLMTGLPDELLDERPHEKEWSLRETLRHITWIERRYATQARYAADRRDGDPIRVATDRLVPEADIDASGDALAILTRLAAARAESHRLLDNVAPAALTRPTQWMHYDVDLRFRLHRFAAHVSEHTVQCEKTLATLGWRATEGRRIVRLVAAAIGEIEGLGATDEARKLEAALVERFASVTA
jgi:hypothetical protein